jgi:thiosulfate reductase cytochrome b subunit
MPADIGLAASDPIGSPQGGDFVRRHRVSTRVWHWVNAITLLILLMSGLMIFNAHPRLYWGQYGANPDPAWLEIGHVEAEGGQERGFLRVGSLEIPTTGVLGVWTEGDEVRTRAFPSWATLPGSYNLGLARRWHLTFAWAFAAGIVLYGLRSLWNGHLRRDLLPTQAELRPSHLWHDVKEHARLRFPKGTAALKYGILQKASYLGVIAVLIPIMILTGLTMSPAMTAAWPWLVDLFGGRQSARSIHFIAASFLATFIVVHLVMVLLAGPFNEIRSMITGRFRLPREKP